MKEQNEESEKRKAESGKYGAAAGERRPAFRFSLPLDMESTRDAAAGTARFGNFVADLTVTAAAFTIYAATLSGHPSWDSLRFAASLAAGQWDWATSAHHPLGGLLAYTLYRAAHALGWRVQRWPPRLASCRGARADGARACLGADRHGHGHDESRDGDATARRCRYSVPPDAVTISPAHRRLAPGIPASVENLLPDEQRVPVLQYDLAGSQRVLFEVRAKPVSVSMPRLRRASSAM